jgi:hypothetical protein
LLRDERRVPDDFRDDDFRDDDERLAAVLRPVEREDDLRPPEREDERFVGTFLPSRRASERPIAIACLRLVTFLPLRPLFSLPSLRSCIARSTFLLAPCEYLRAIVGSS